MVVDFVVSVLDAAFPGDERRLVSLLARPVGGQVRSSAGVALESAHVLVILRFRLAASANDVVGRGAHIRSGAQAATRAAQIQLSAIKRALHQGHAHDDVVRDFESAEQDYYCGRILDFSHIQYQWVALIHNILLELFVVDVQINSPKDAFASVVRGRYVNADVICSRENCD